MSDSKLETWDFVAVGLYFAAVLGAGLYSMCRSNRGTVSGYFLAGRYMIWLPVGASLFASNIGSEHFIGLAGSGAAAGIAVGAFELNACMLLQVLGWLFLPVYIASGVCTLPEYMKKRFGGTRIRIYLACLSLILYIFTKISVNLYSGALFIQQALNWNLYLSVLLLLAATAFCTVTGGLAAVIYTDTLQAFVMVIGALALTIISFIKVGGYEELYRRYMHAVPNSTLLNANQTCGYPREDSWIMLRDPVHSDMPWPGFLLGQTPASIWYWCTDQMMVQRALAAKSLSHAQGGTLFAGYIKLLPLFIIILPGMISRVLYTNEVACVDPEECYRICGSRMGCSNIAYPKLVLNLMPVGLKGVMLSVMLAALMSDLTSIFNSASTLFTMDVYRFIRRKAKVRELMIVGRVFVVLMVGIGIVWIPLIQEMQGGQLYIYIQAISAYLAPPIASVYLIAMLWKRGNEQGAFWGLMAGMIVGVVRMIMDFVYREPHCGQVDDRPAIIKNVHYMYFAMFLFWLSGITMIIISLASANPSQEQLIRTTFWTRRDQTVREDEKEERRQIQEEVDKMDEKKERVSGQEVKQGKDEELGVEYRLEGSKPEQGHILLKPKDVTGAIKTDTVQIMECEDQHKKNLVCRGYDWFCGFDSSEEGRRAALEQALRLQKITSLRQNRWAKIFLNCNLVFLVAVAIFLYIFCSTGSNFGLIQA